ncbi:MAG: protein translocase subunit SecF [Alphaproteobacteria bacterium]|nr:protein translocase subunit SecF [Alphaproteobacteria bacterium]
MLNIFQKRELDINFIGKRGLGFFLSVVLLAVSIFSLCTKGLNYGIDFEGGLLIEATSEQVVDIKKVRDSLSFLRDLSIQTAGTEGKTILIQAKPEANQNTSQLVTKIKEILGAGYQYGQVEMIGPTIGKELKEKSLMASVLALLVISIYIWFRFEWPFALGCLLALAHDMVIVVGAFSLFQWEFDMVVVAGLLSLAGYDCNDSIVTYDRVRENLRKFRKTPVDDILNRSINETLSRTILTSLTTLFVVVVLLFVGGETLRGFSIAMVLGTIFGTYSSICIAVPLLRYFDIRSVGEVAEKQPEG